MPRRQKVPRGVQMALQRAARGEVQEPQLAELASHFFQVSGGPRAVAKMLHDEFCGAKPGSVVRQRILDMILRCVRFANEKSPPPADLGALTEEDLEREVQTLIGGLDLGGGEDEVQGEGEAGADAARENS